MNLPASQSHAVATVTSHASHRQTRWYPIPNRFPVRVPAGWLGSTEGSPQKRRLWGLEKPRPQPPTGKTVPKQPPHTTARGPGDEKPPRRHVRHEKQGDSVSATCLASRCEHSGELFPAWTGWPENGTGFHGSCQNHDLALLALLAVQPCAVVLSDHSQNGPTGVAPAQGESEPPVGLRYRSNQSAKARRSQLIVGQPCDPPG